MWYLAFLLSLLFAPLLPGIINRTKAAFAGRQGPSIWQLYFDLAKLLRKSVIYSSTSTALFRLAPTLALAATVGAALWMPLGNAVSPFAFTGDVVLFFHLLALGRVLTMLAALDTGSAFEGMGASREAQFSALAETITFAVLGFLALLTHSVCLSTLLTGFNSAVSWNTHGTSMMLAIIASCIVALVENCRVPFDDPETHLELTMIHEAMILDNSGPDLAIIHYNAALKLHLFLAFIALQILPLSPSLGPLGLLAFFCLIPLLAIGVGVIESIMGRYRFLKLPQVFAGGLAIAVLSILLFYSFQA